MHRAFVYRMVDDQLRFQRSASGDVTLHPQRKAGSTAATEPGAMTVASDLERARGLVDHVQSLGHDQIKKVVEGCCGAGAQHTVSGIGREVIGALGRVTIVVDDEDDDMGREVIDALGRVTIVLGDDGDGGPGHRYPPLCLRAAGATEAPTQK